MDDRTTRHLADALRGLTQANVYDFQNVPGLCDAFEKDYLSDRLIYVSDRESCGLPDCWSTFRGLHDRYVGDPHVPLDCEDIACATAAFLTVRYCVQTLVGLRPGKRIAHCVCGYLDEDGNIVLMDPSITFGMPPLLPDYSGIFWRKI